jgi:hypothetical protein
MVPVEWPVAAADTGGAALPARVAGPSRLPAARTDFFLDPAARLTEQERALMTGMLRDLVDSLADELRVLLAGCEPANDEDDQLFGRLRASGLLDIPELVQLLLNRAEEERISTAIRAGRSGKHRFVQSLVSDEDPDVAAAAMGLILARGRRRDRFEGPRIIFDDLGAETAAALVDALAAAFRAELAKRIGEVEADDRLTAAGRALLSHHDEGNRVEARLFELTHALDKAGRLDDGFILSAFRDGEPALVAEALARRAGIRVEEAWQRVGGRAGDFALLLRLAAADRTVAGELIALLAEIGARTDAEAEIAAFDSLRDEEIEQARKWLRLDAGYRAAIESLAARDGQRAF